MHVAGLQMDLAWEDPGTNLGRAERWVEQAAARGARLAVLPEMFNTGFTMRAEAAAAHAEMTARGLADIARRHDLWLIGGFAAPGSEGGLARNTARLITPAGEEALRYDKIHPFSHAGEHEHYEGGTALATADVEGLRVTPLVCYDLRFPEPFRAAAEATDLFVVIANWPEPRRTAWRTLLRARAIENQCYVLGVNRVGEGDGLRYEGDSALVDPTGQTVAEARGTEAVVSADVAAEAVRRARAAFSFLADRRPAVYATL